MRALVSASGTGVAGLRRSGQELPQTQSDWFTSLQIFYWHILAASMMAGRQMQLPLLFVKLAKRQLRKNKSSASLRPHGLPTSVNLPAVG